MDTASNACWGYAAVHWLIVFLGGGFLECTVSTILTLMIVAFCNRTLWFPKAVETPQILCSDVCLSKNIRF